MADFTLLGFAAFLGERLVVMDHETNEAMKKAAMLVEHEAKSEIGIYQDQAGPFAGWAELAQSTKDDRVAQGYSENDPLLRSGKVRDSIGHVAKGHEAVIGSNDDIAVMLELGTSRMPPRSFLGGAGFRKGPEVAKILGHGAVKALVGAEVAGRLLPIP